MYDSCLAELKMAVSKAFNLGAKIYVTYALFMKTIYISRNHSLSMAYFWPNMGEDETIDQLQFLLSVKFIDSADFGAQLWLAQKCNFCIFQVTISYL